jgi:PhoPQ-activated pathogenicity-related protein
MLTALLALMLPPDPPTELYDYLARADTAYQWTHEKARLGHEVMRVTSQVWQGRPWTHSVTVFTPRHLKHKGHAVLIVTGGGINDRDLGMAELLAQKSGMVVATLFDIPNQPLYERYEDDLIAHTFERYFQTGDPSWPLLFPMTKSAIRAMDAVAEFTKSTDNPVGRFVVTGASKRGWTTWFVGVSGDERVVGIAPAVYDNLNIPAQMKGQIESWGEYSEMIADYTQRGLQELLATEQGMRLARAVDPYSYLARLKAPTLIINGSNDRYWTVDALRHYYSDLPARPSVLIVPNAGHGLGDPSLVGDTAAAFAASCAGAFRFPELVATFEQEQVRFESRGANPLWTRLWMATSGTLDFRESKWEEVAKTERVAPLQVPTDRSRDNRAVLIESRYRIEGYEFSLTSPVHIYRKR